MFLFTYISYHYSVNYNGEFHLVTKIILIVYFPARIAMPFHELMGPFRGTGTVYLYAHGQYKSVFI